MDDEDSGLSNSEEEESGYSESELADDVPPIQPLALIPERLQQNNNNVIEEEAEAPNDKEDQGVVGDDPLAGEGVDHEVEGTPTNQDQVQEDEVGKLIRVREERELQQQEEEKEEPVPSTSAQAIQRDQQEQQKKKRIRKKPIGITKWTFPPEFYKKKFPPYTVGEALQRGKSRHVGEETLLERVPLTTNDVVNLTVSQNDPKLVQIEYPGIVKNPDRAVRTLGGIIGLSQVFSNPKKKLKLKFRPGDPFCNPVMSDCRLGCGLLIKVRRRKNPLTKQESVPVVSEGEEEVMKTSLEDKSKEDILNEEMELLKKLELKKKKRDSNFILMLPEKNKAPPQVISEPEESSNIKAEIIGIIPQTYAFNALADFQYLPIKTEPGQAPVSILNRIFPFYIHANPEDIPLPEISAPSFIAPPIISRYDKPNKGILKMLEDRTGLVNKELPIKSSSTVLRSLRRKRLIYTQLYDFQMEDEKFKVNPDNSKVPSEPHHLAVADVEKRGYDHDGSRSQIQGLFEQRPIWSKQAVEYVMGSKSDYRLKYLLPSVAYFASNGPWRSLWIRMGYDPRRDPGSFYYQLFDYRYPSQYKEILKSMEPYHPLAYHAFKPGIIPAKAQMFFQLCDISLPELEAMKESIAARLNPPNVIPFNVKFGYLTEDIFEYIRYCITRHIELHLYSLRKIPKVNSPHIEFGDKGNLAKYLMRARTISHYRTKRSRRRIPISNQSFNQESEATRIAKMIKRKATRKKVVTNKGKLNERKKTLQGVSAIQIKRPL